MAAMDILLGIFVATIIGFVCLNQYFKRYRRRLNLPPGSLGLPVIGETLSFYRALRSNRLFEDFFGKRVEKHGKVFKTGLMGSPTVVFTGPVGNRFLMANEFKLVVSSWPKSTIDLMGSGSIMEKQGSEHRCLRGVVMACFRGALSETFVGKMSSVTERHFASHWKGESVVCVFPLTKLLTFSCVCSFFLGLEDDEQVEDFLKLFKIVLAGSLSIPFDFPGTRYRRAMTARSDIDRILSTLIEKRRGDLQEGRAFPDQDLLSRLLTVSDEDGKKLTDKEVMDNIVLLMFAAYDTTSLVITMMCRMLGEHKDCYQEMLREHQEILSTKQPNEKLHWEDVKRMKYTWRVAQETMRIIPPIFGSFKKTIVDVDFEGYNIPKGWKVLWTASTHYDDEYFPEPEKFKPSRFEDTIPPHIFVAFGGGPRLCAGYELAKLQIRVFMHHLITRYEWCVMDTNEGMKMDPLPIPTNGMSIRLVEKT